MYYAKKNGIWKNITIVVLLLVIIGLGVFITYEKITSSDKISKLANEVKTLKSEIKQEKNSIKSVVSTETKDADTLNDSQEHVQKSNYINAIYWGSSADYNESSEVVLFSDGKCLSLHVGGEYHLGTYKIENGQLFLALSVYDSTTTEVYNISNDYNTIKHI